MNKILLAIVASYLCSSTKFIPLAIRQQLFCIQYLSGQVSEVKKDELKFFFY